MRIAQFRVVVWLQKALFMGSGEVLRVGNDLNPLPYLSPSKLETTAKQRKHALNDEGAPGIRMERSWLRILRHGLTPAERVLPSSTTRPASAFSGLVRLPGIVGCFLAISGGFFLHILSPRILMLITGVAIIIESLLFPLSPRHASYWACIFTSTVAVHFIFNVADIYFSTSLHSRQQGLAVMCSCSLASRSCRTSGSKAKLPERFLAQRTKIVIQKGASIQQKAWRGYGSTGPAANRTQVFGSQGDTLKTIAMVQFPDVLATAPRDQISKENTIDVCLSLFKVCLDHTSWGFSWISMHWFMLDPGLKAYAQTPEPPQKCIDPPLWLRSCDSRRQSTIIGLSSYGFPNARCEAVRSREPYS
ncbi:uncharacterized protein MYCFIDRAFT_170866 [Pseudocercospora fijiensis CIRAD86]|uniref:Uncharacterized protein n=1 Tax=Pseudocercospora fijiensis (strain CIRAD86) TaxID=383855 RepID=N1QCW6_PSEFD|nr:uncharacterized protein MYCFIDRAFT_170866 [Pseudocercospora fijiensis CIRAD86]EME89408.1 hypothetical protein MYCFIDRAFT_170866 [Pseudocercospora fijiensis CIRAD86]